MDLKKQKDDNAMMHAAAPSNDDLSPNALDAHELVSIGGKHIKRDEENLKMFLPQPLPCHWRASVFH